MNDGLALLAEDPVSWVKTDFRKWKMLPRGTAAQTTTPNPATQVSSNTTAPTPPSTTKLEDDALLN